MIAVDWCGVRRILCIRLDYMGDVLMSTPAIRALRQSASGCEITLLTSASGATIARFIPEIDHVIEYQAPWLKSSAPHAPEIDLAMIAELAQMRFDAAVIFTVYSQNPLPAAMLCYLAGIPLRLAHCRENPYQLLTHWVSESEPHARVRHEVRRQLDLVASVGARTSDERLSLRVPDNALAQVRELLCAVDIDPTQPWIALHPGATASSRRYPPQLWREVVRELSSALHCPIVFTGSADEVPLIDEIKTGLPDCHSFAGKLELGQLAALIERAPVLLSNNTGPVHIAAAVGTAVVDLYALTNPQHAPWQVRSRVLYRDVPCRYCYKSLCPEGHQHCLSLVPPSDVVQAALALLNGAGDERTQPDGVSTSLPPILPLSR